MMRDRGDPRVTKAHFLDTLGGGIALESGLDVLLKHRAHMRQSRGKVARKLESSGSNAFALAGIAHVELQLALHLHVQLTQCRIEGVTNEIVYPLIAQIGPAKMRREQHREECVENGLQGLPRGHLMDALFSPALLRTRAGGAQFRNDEIEFPRRARE